MGSKRLTRRLPLPALLASCLALSLGAQPGRASLHGGTGASRAAIAAVEQRWVTALNDADISAIDEILADDFVRPAPASGTFVSKAELLGYYRSHLSAHSGITRRIEGMTIRVDGRTGIARGIVVTTSADHKHDSRQLFTDVFVLRSGRWRAVSAQENRITQ